MIRIPLLLTLERLCLIIYVITSSWRIKLLCLMSFCCSWVPPHGRWHKHCHAEGESIILMSFLGKKQHVLVLCSNNERCTDDSSTGKKPKCNCYSKRQSCLLRLTINSHLERNRVQAKKKKTLLGLHRTVKYWGLDWSIM